MPLKLVVPHAALILTQRMICLLGNVVDSQNNITPTVVA